MKKSFFEFLNEYKINSACKLLIETNKQISEVCYAAGLRVSLFSIGSLRNLRIVNLKTTG